MKELVIENLHKTYGIKDLLKGISLSIKEGDRIGLIGPNGTGKSSFLKVLAGKDHYDAGNIQKPNQYRVSYLAQNPELNPNKTILATVFDSDAPMIQLILAYEEAQLALAQDPDNQTLLKAFMDLTDQVNQENAWDAEVKAKTILSQLGLHDIGKLIKDCSGGQQKRVGLAQALISAADLLILDEPTNHLDIETVQWLEKYLSTYPGALLLVTHDRYFLERVVNQMIELKYGQIRIYEGNYQTYLEKRALQAELENSLQNKQDRLFQQELAWMRQGAKARTTKQQARIERFNQLKTEIGNRNQANEAINFAFEQQRIGNRILELESVSLKAHGLTIIDNYTKHFVKGDRLGIIGANGIGKSTLLNSLAGSQAFSKGTYQVGQTVRLAYYRQLDEDLPNDMRVLAFLTKIADQFKRPDGTSVTAAQMLERFNFPRNTHGMLIQQLSGGERRRLYLLSLLIQEPNVLLLDEPTNDLDIETLTVLEDYIDDFEGVVIIVSHDRYFLDKTVDQILILEGQGAYQIYDGAYSDYLVEKQVQSKTEKSQEVSLSKEQASYQSRTHKAPRLSYQEKKEWETIETRLNDLESQIAGIQAEMNQSGSDAGKLMTLQAQLESLEADLLIIYERYEYLSQIVEGGSV